MDTIDRGNQRVLTPDYEINPTMRQDIHEDNRDNYACMIDSNATNAIIGSEIFHEIVYG